MVGGEPAEGDEVGVLGGPSLAGMVGGGLAGVATAVIVLVSPVTTGTPTGRTVVKVSDERASSDGGLPKENTAHSRVAATMPAAVMPAATMPAAAIPSVSMPAIG